MKVWYIFFFLIYLKNCNLIICNEFVCCSDFCNNCTNCDITNLTIYQNCCQNYITNNNISCLTNNLPCNIENDNNETNKSNLEIFINYITIPYLIIIIILFLIFICGIYSCTCFDKRKPLVEYELIKWYPNSNWINKNK